MSDDERTVSEQRTDELKMGKIDAARQLEHTGQCPLCPNGDVNEEWHRAFPEGAVKTYECTCGLRLFVPGDTYKREVEPTDRPR